MIEVPGDERDVEIARLADRLAVIEALEHREEPRMPLHLTGERVEEAGAHVGREPRPDGRRRIGGGNGRIDVRLAPLRDARQDRLRRGIDRLEIVAFGGSNPTAGDEVPEAPVVVLFEPLQRRRVALRRRSVLHRLEQLGDGCHYTIGWRWAAA